MKISKVCFLILIGFSLVLSSCGRKEEEKQEEPVKPELSVIQNICELSTLKCRYNNVAKSVKESGSGFLHWGEKERKFWIEYTGEVVIGIDMSKVGMKIQDDKVMIVMPRAKLISIKADEKSLNEDSYVASNDAFFNKNKITASDQQQAIQDAQNTMKKKVEEDDALFLRAEKRAKDLIENYVKRIGKLTETEYQISWEFQKE